MWIVTTRGWLRQNGYEDVVELIDEVVATLAARGSKERRNWWDVLAGGKDGRPSVVACTFYLFIRPISYPVLCQNSNLLK